MQRLTRWLSAALLVAASCGQPDVLRAQTLAQVSAKVDTLSQVIGDYKRVIPCATLDVNRPTLVLGDGGYPERFRLKQIGCAIDAAVELVGSFAADMNRLRTQVDALAVKVASLTAGPSGPIIAPTVEGGNLYVPGKLIVYGKICIVEAPYATDCDPDKVEQMQIRGRSHASIGFAANLSNEWRQGDTPAEGTGPGYSSVGMSPDLGLRLCQNQYWGVNGYVSNVSPTKGKGCTGFDSQAQWSHAFLGIGATDPHTQQMVLLDTPQGISWVVWRPDKPACLISSSQKYYADEVLCTAKTRGARRGTPLFPKLPVDTTARMYWQ
jgi:hypothetical protein